MNEFILMVVIYINSAGGGFQMLPMGEQVICRSRRAQSKAKK